MIVAVVLFTIAALGGATLLAVRAKSGENPPTALALVHGGAAAAALVALLVPVATSEVSTTTLVATGLFVVAALGGFALFASHLRGKRISIPIVLVHGGVAVVAFVLLLSAVFG